jgi:hypothetical protein
MPSMTRTFVASLFAIAVVNGPLLGGFAGNVAHAQDAAEDPAVGRARQQFREGVALMAAKDWVGALAKFKAVGEVKMNAQVAFNIAECERELGRLVSALGNYRLALAKSGEGGADAVLAAAPKHISDLEARIATLTIQRVEPTPNTRAVIDLDGKELVQEQVGKPISVDPGERTVRILVDGKPVKTEKIKLGDGEKKEIKLEIPAPVEGDTGPTTTGSGGPSIPGIVMTVAGGGMLVAGFVFIGLRQVAISDLDELCGGDTSCPPSAQPTYDQGRLMTGLAEAFIPIGTVTAVVGIVLIATMSGGGSETPEAATPDTAFVPLSPDGSGPGLSVFGTF